MDPGRASVTAMGTALMRADHTRSARQPLIDDPWGDRLVTDDYRSQLRENALSELPPESQERLPTLPADELLGFFLRRHPSYATIIVRARYTEEMLAAAVGRGVRQYVIVGAGLDSFALRRPRFAAELEVFELDHPDTQRFKLARLAECGNLSPGGVHYIGADLALEGVDRALRRASFDTAVPSFFSWLGVTAYLNREANMSTLRSIASCGAPGSEIVFDYGDQQAYDNPPTDERSVRIRARLARVGEPWISGFYPAQLDDDLRAVGLELVENLSPEDLHRRYCAGSHDDLKPSPNHYLARACVLS
jgi:methyltransferase (TIGR00027 family)